MCCGPSRPTVAEAEPTTEDGQAMSEAGIEGGIEEGGAACYTHNSPSRHARPILAAAPCCPRSRDSRWRASQLRPSSLHLRRGPAGGGDEPR